MANTINVSEEIKETTNGIIKVLNNSKLHPSILSLILQNVYNDLQILTMKEQSDPPTEKGEEGGN